VHVAIDVGFTQTWADINSDMHRGKTVHYLQFTLLQNSLAYNGFLLSQFWVYDNADNTAVFPTI
jgi:hypothetical protein